MVARSLLDRAQRLTLIRKSRATLFVCSCCLFARAAPACGRESMLMFWASTPCRGAKTCFARARLTPSRILWGISRYTDPKSSRLPLCLKSPRPIVTSLGSTNDRRCFYTCLSTCRRLRRFPLRDLVHRAARQSRRSPKGKTGATEN
jgi:hypothetical protein